MNNSIEHNRKPKLKPLTHVLPVTYTN